MTVGVVVLPDTEPGARARALVPQPARTLATHASGRPWLVGAWPDNDVLTAEVGATRLVVLGGTPIDAAKLERLASRVRRLSDLDACLPDLMGSCFLAASVGGQVRFQGSLSGLRRVFFARVGDATIAGDRSDMLAGMSGAGVDEEALALRVACGLQVPYPANARSVWAGVRTLAPEDYLSWDGDRTREVTWWRAPTLELSLPEGAAAVRTALTEVLERLPVDERVSADLSGGLDSTSLCFLAARRTHDLLTFRWGEAEAGNDDATYAASASALLDEAEHLVVAQHELPAMFAEPSSSSVSREEPAPLSRATARMRHGAELLARRGSRRHLAGHGGDELFAPQPTYLHQLARRSPATALRHVRAYAALRRWPLAATLAELRSTVTFAAWWQRSASDLLDPPPRRRAPALGWGLGSMRAAPWTTGEGIDLARHALRRTAEQVQPLADDLGQHTLLLVLRSNTASYRLLGQLYAEAGVALDMPYLDDAVLDVVLRVPAHEQGGPWRYKPLLADAVQDVVPDQIRSRSTKGEFSEDVRRGMRQNLPEVLRVVEDGALAERGLIDPRTVRERLSRPQPDGTAVQALENLLACETWLRTATDGVDTARQHVDRATLEEV